MLRFPLLHPPLLSALAVAGHGSRILLADANYPHATGVHPSARCVYLNLRPGTVAVDEVLETLLTAIPVEAAHVMQPEDASTPPVFDRFRELLGRDAPSQSLAPQPMERFAFYDACRQPDLAVCVASGDTRLYANVLLTVGVVTQ